MSNNTLGEIRWLPRIVAWVGFTAIAILLYVEPKIVISAGITTIMMILLVITMQKDDPDTLGALVVLAVGWAVICAGTYFVRWPPHAGPIELYVWSWTFGATAMFLGPLTVITLRIILEHVVAPLGGLLIAGFVIVFDAIMALFFLRRAKS